MVKKSKKSRRVLIVLLILIGTALALNLILTKRLEYFLRRELSIRTSEATDGFYKLSFDKLTISFFKGELRMEGISLEPDSVVFMDWQQKDSLPDSYVIAHIGIIDFKGLNLTWRESYKKLHFEAFAIQRPDIRIINPYDSLQTASVDSIVSAPKVQTKTLYEVISPYINVLTVNSLNLDSASVSYEVETSLAAYPLYYALQNVSFNATGFVLDQYSSESGKLLYCDNFQFQTNQPQTLFKNEDFTLDTRQIKLSTEDSLIYVADIRFSPQRLLWKTTGKHPTIDLDALINDVSVKGIHFLREKGLNYLVAKTFQIGNSKIAITNQVARKKEQNKSVSVSVAALSADSLVNDLSLYQLIAPILNSIVIDTIGLSKAEMQYRWSSADTMDIFKIEDFTFQAVDFKVDSSTNLRHNPFYSSNFIVEASGMDAVLPAQNHRMSLQRLSINYQKGDISIDRFHIQPLSTYIPGLYFTGSVDSILFKGITYADGVTVDAFQIFNPRLSCTISADQKSKKGKNRPTTFHPEYYLNPLFTYLNINRFNLWNASVTLDDQTAEQPVIYRLNHFDFFASGIEINKETVNRKFWFFDYSNIGCRFSGFNNFLPGKNYNLTINRGSFSTLKGSLLFKDVAWTTVNPKAKLQLEITTPKIQISGLNKLPEHPNRNIQLSSFNVDTLSFCVKAEKGETLSAKMDDFVIDSINWDSTQLYINHIALKHPEIRFTTLLAETKDSVKMKHKDTLNPDGLYKTLRQFSQQIVLNDFSVSDASLQVEIPSLNQHVKSYKLTPVNLYVNKLAINNNTHEFELGALDFFTRNLSFPINDGFYNFSIGSFRLTKNSIQLDTIALVSPYSMMEFAYKQPHHKDWFQLATDQILLAGIDVPYFLSNKELRIDSLLVNSVLLQNFKNKQIPVSLHEVPVIYGLIKKIPIRFDVKKGIINDFTVIYQELDPHATAPGKLIISDMNGRFNDFTNITSQPDQYVVVNATGKMMGKREFTGVWKIPLNSPTDRFYLNGHISDFDLTDLNPLIFPMTSAKIRKGHLNDLRFDAVADNEGGHVDLMFLYNDLYVELMKKEAEGYKDRVFISDLINLVLKHDNPSIREGRKEEPRNGNVTFIRNPYHSSFNYFWQILKPALIQSVGITEKTQEKAEEAIGFIEKVKKFFSRKKHKENSKTKDLNETEDVFKYE